MKVLLTGSTGLVGSALLQKLRSADVQVDILVRHPRVNGAPPGGKAIQWNPVTGVLDSNSLEGYDAIVHLAGENIAEGRWTKQKMARIRDSRVQGTKLLASTIARLERKPLAFICASAVGFYGDRGNELLTEGSQPGKGFLANVCRAWEEACAPATDVGVRVVNLRIGMVLSAKGGALGKMLLPFQLGLGGRIGSGEQWMSWIELGDLVALIRHAMTDPAMSGAVNAVSPEPVTNLDYSKTLGRVLGRPTVLPLPAAGARIALGKMADELLLASTRVEPQVLRNSQFVFNHPSLARALGAVLGR